MPWVIAVTAISFWLLPQVVVTPFKKIWSQPKVCPTGSLLFSLVAVMAPITEELCFRGLLYQPLSQLDELVTSLTYQWVDLCCNSSPRHCSLTDPDVFGYGYGMGRERVAPLSPPLLCTAMSHYHEFCTLEQWLRLNQFRIGYVVCGVIGIRSP